MAGFSEVPMPYWTKLEKLALTEIYLKQQNGKEFTLEFLLEAKLGPDGEPLTILSQRKR